MKNNNFTYKKSGVNISKADKFVKFISTISKKTINPKTNFKKFKNIGSFGSIFDLSKLKIKEPVIVSSTDGVGTKIEIANQIKKFDSIGIDLVAMCVNDLIVQGAKPLFFLDYISINKLELNKTKKIILGIVKGCKLAGCELIGGETAEMPGTYGKGKFDIAGFSVGIVEKKKLLSKLNVKKNNIILAIPSSGIHSNGLSLVRYILKKKKINLNKSSNKKINIKNELIKPTKIYVKEIIKLAENNLINGCANITGGGLYDNLIRIIPKGLQANINLEKIKVLKIFKWLKQQGISQNQMLKTFNCGVGFCLIVNKKNIKKIQNKFDKKFKPYVLGFISKGKNKLSTHGKINW